MQVFELKPLELRAKKYARMRRTDVYLSTFMSCVGQVEAEVSRLEHLKFNKMKELVVKRKVELEQICSQMHIVTEAVNAMEYSVEATESGKNFIYLFRIEGHCKQFCI